MAEKSRFWDGTSVGDASASPYDASTEFADVMMDACGAGGIVTNLSGVVRGGANQLSLTGAVSPVVIGTGSAFTYGTWYKNDTAVSVVVPTPGGATRQDRIVLRKSWSGQTVRVTRIAGVEGGGAPALTQVAGTTWDEPLYLISITTGAAITVLTDERQFVGNDPLFSAMGAGLAPGAILYAASGSLVTTLPIGATQTTLVSNGSVPSWSANPTVSGISSVAAFSAVGSTATIQQQRQGGVTANHVLTPGAQGVSNQYGLFNSVAARYEWYTTAAGVMTMPQGFAAGAASSVTGTFTVTGTVAATTVTASANGTSLQGTTIGGSGLVVSAITGGLLLSTGDFTVSAGSIVQTTGKTTTQKATTPAINGNGGVYVSIYTPGNSKAGLIHIVASDAAGTIGYSIWAFSTTAAGGVTGLNPPHLIINTALANAVTDISAVSGGSDIQIRGDNAVAPTTVKYWVEYLPTF